MNGNKKKVWFQLQKTCTSLNNISDKWKRHVRVLCVVENKYQIIEKQKYAKIASIRTSLSKCLFRFSFPNWNVFYSSFCGVLLDVKNDKWVLETKPKEHKLWILFIHKTKLIIFLLLQLVTSLEADLLKSFICG